MIAFRANRAFSSAAGMVAMLFLCVCGTWGQRKTAEAVNTHYRIAGQVVSAADGHALTGTTVSLSDVRGAVPMSSVVAGDGGAFAFDSLPAGKYSLFGQRRGFVGASYGEHEQFSVALVTGASFETEKLVLRLEPAAVVAGRVFDEDGELIRGAQVTLYREGFETGKKEIKSFNSTQTDPFGEFAFSQLKSGRYFISVRATPWYAVAPAPAEQQSFILTGVDPAFNAAYPLTFYGDVTKSDDATPIALKPGERLNADVHLLPVRALKLSLKNVSGSPAGIVASLQVPVFGSFEQLPAQIQQLPDGGSEVVGLAPAQYRFETFDPASGNKSQMGEVNLSGGSTEIDSRASVAQGSLSLTVVVDTGEKPPAQTIIALRGSQPGTDLRQMLNENGAVSFRGVPPDDYHFLIFGENHTWQVLQIEEGGNFLSQNHRQLAAGESASLKLVVSGTARSVDGLAVLEGKPVAGAMIVLVPVDAIANSDLFRRDQSDQDGTFALLDVPAGRYILVAIQNGWHLEWSKPEVLAPFLANGIAVDVRTTQRESLKLTTPIAVQVAR